MSSVRRAWLVPVLLFATWSAGLLPGDEIYLADGRVIEGEIISAADADIIDIRVGSAGLVAIQHFLRTKVLRVEHKVSARQTAVSALHQQVEKLNANPNASVTDWWTLTRKFQDRGEQATAKDLAARVLVLDRHHADARKLLGMVQCRGVWMRPNEIATARGESFFRGAWATWAQQEEILTDESRRKEEQTALRKEREEQRRQARIAAAAAAESTAAMQETYVSDYYRSPYGMGPTVMGPTAPATGSVMATEGESTEEAFTGAIVRTAHQRHVGMSVLAVAGAIMLGDSVGPGHRAGAIRSFGAVQSSAEPDPDLTEARSP